MLVSVQLHKLTLKVFYGMVSLSVGDSGDSVSTEVDRVQLPALSQRQRDTGQTVVRQVNIFEVLQVRAKGVRNLK